MLVRLPGQPLDRVAPVVEDPFEIASDEDAMRDRSERPVRHPVENGVTDPRTVVLAASKSCVCSQVRNGPFDLRVDEPPSWLPFDDLGAPVDRERRWVVSTYSIVVPSPIGIGRGVRTRKPSHGGVSASRL